MIIKNTKYGSYFIYVILLKINTFLVITLKVLKYKAQAVFVQKMKSFFFCIMVLI